jgi:hypothetical protein
MAKILLAAMRGAVHGRSEPVGGSSKHQSFVVRYISLPGLLRAR